MKSAQLMRSIAKLVCSDTRTVVAAIQQPMLLKGVVVGDKLVLNWLSLKSSKAEPEQIELDVNKFTTASEGLTSQELQGRLCLTCSRASHTMCLQVFQDATRI